MFEAQDFKTTEKNEFQTLGYRYQDGFNLVYLWMV